MPKTNDLVIVVSDERMPNELLGTYVKTDEDAVIYEARTGIEVAPVDVVRVVNVSKLLNFTTAEADMLYGMLTQRYYIRQDDPEHEHVGTARDKVYPFTSTYAEVIAALEAVKKGRL
jgi:hypothetical protein